MPWCGSGIKKSKTNHLYNLFIDSHEICYFPFVKRRLLISSLFILLNGLAFSQELNGIWKGTLTQQPGGCFPVYNVELQVSIVNNQVSGFCYHYSDVRNYVKKN